MNDTSLNSNIDTSMPPSSDEPGARSAAALSPEKAYAIYRNWYWFMLVGLSFAFVVLHHLVDDYLPLPFGSNTGRDILNGILFFALIRFAGPLTIRVAASRLRRRGVTEAFSTYEIIRRNGEVGILSTAVSDGGSSTVSDGEVKIEKKQLPVRAADALSPFTPPLAPASIKLWDLRKRWVRIAYAMLVALFTAAFLPILFDPGLNLFERIFFTPALLLMVAWSFRRIWSIFVPDLYADEKGVWAYRSGSRRLMSWEQVTSFQIFIDREPGGKIKVYRWTLLGEGARTHFRVKVDPETPPEEYEQLKEFITQRMMATS